MGFEKIGHTVLVHDVKDGTAMSDLVVADIIYLCVPTPSCDDGGCDISIVESCLRELEILGYAEPVVIKSTVEPGTTARLNDKFGLNIAFVPEFLRERCAIYDFVENQELLAIGTTDDDAASKIIESHGRLPKHVKIMSPTEAELTKYYSNVFNAMRIIFANEMFEVANALGANYDAIKDAFLTHSGIQDIYLDVNDNFRGYAGPCLPKDVKALAKLCVTLGLDLNLFKTIDEENAKFKKTVFEGMRS
jgi:UDPglucose 6-dehydrogenase